MTSFFFVFILEMFCILSKDIGSPLKKIYFFIVFSPYMQGVFLAEQMFFCKNDMFHTYMELQS